jgi:hypothetical protein
VRPDTPYLLATIAVVLAACRVGLYVVNELVKMEQRLADAEDGLAQLRTQADKTSIESGDNRRQIGAIRTVLERRRRTPRTADALRHLFTEGHDAHEDN